MTKSVILKLLPGSLFSVGAPADTRRFGFVQKDDCHPERRLMTHLSAQGMQANQQIFFLSDGADNLRDLQFGMYPESTHVLDWFHITMRLKVLMQYARDCWYQIQRRGVKFWHCWKALNDISGMAMLSLRWNILIIALCIAMTLNSAILA